MSKLIEPSREEKHALVEAAGELNEHGLDIPFPWEGDLDDREREIYEGFVKACRAYNKTMIELHGDKR